MTLTVTKPPSEMGRASSVDARPPSRRRSRREALVAVVFLAPDVLGLLIFLVLPMLVALGVSLYSVDGFGNYTFSGLANFYQMADDPQLHKSIGVTLTYLVLYVPAVFVVSLALALLVRDPYPGVGLVRASLFLPNVVSLVVVGLLWQFMLVDKRGIVPSVLEPLGLGEISWLGDPTYALITLVVVSIWFLAGYQMLIFLAGLKDIPGEYYDAARVDGASPWHRFRHITWPLLKPTSFFVLITSIVNAVTGLQSLDLVFVMTKGGPANSTSTVVFYTYQQAFQFNNYGYAAAITAVTVGFLVLVTGVMFAVTRGGRFSVG
ncbi:MAG: carbohydrate ABC transporter permease [Micromonosporaceae bacterium]